jgi:dihydroorotase
MKAAIAVVGGRVVDPSTGLDKIANVFVKDGTVAGVAREEPGEDVAVVDATGLVVTAGLIDIHVHLREPGREDEETIETGSMAAAHGGFTTVACMPNTSPPLGDRAAIEFVLSRAEVAGYCRVKPIAALSRNREGRELTDVGDLVDAGAVAVSDDGSPVTDSHLMRRAMEYCRAFGIPVISHCEDLSLSRGGAMHEGVVSTQLGLPPIPAAAEEVMVARDIALARLTRGRLHVAHASTAGTVELIRRAKQEGLHVTAEAAPHHLVLCDEDVMGFDPNTKVNPPLRSPEDRDALRQAVKEGVIDALASDHAPHALEEKTVEYTQAPFGLVGLETTVGLVLGELVGPGTLGLATAIRCLTSGPARVLGLAGGSLAEGAPADLTLLSLDEEWVVTAQGFYSRSSNSPFLGRTLHGKAIKTILAGRVVELPPRDE